MSKRQEDRLLDNGWDDAEIMIIEDDALCESLVGVTSDERAVYDESKMAEEMMQAYGMTYEDAIEHIEFNIVRALPYYGDKAPIIYNPLE